MNKVLFVLGISTYPSITGGMEVFNYYLIKALENDLDISYLSTQKMDIEKAKHQKCYSIRPSKYLFPLQLFLHLLFSKRIDKVVFSFSASHAIVWKLYNRICRLLKKKYIVVIHFGDVTPNQNDDIYRRFFNEAETVVAVSDDIKKNYDIKYGLDCKIIYPLVPFRESNVAKEDLRKKYDIPQNANAVCMVGSLKGMKNPNTIIDAIHSFSKEEFDRYNPHVIFAGDGVEMESLKNKVANYNLTKHVTFLGNVPKDTVNEIYKLSDYYLIASDFEGTSVSLLEAMFNKKPIIASRVPGIVNTINEHSECLMFSVKNVKELKDCLLRYFDNPELVQQITKKAGRHFLSTYNYDNVVKAYINILDK